MSLRSPDDVRATLERKYASHRALWWAGEGDWPLTMPLGDVNERRAAEDPQAVRAWANAWVATTLGQITWEERHWPRLGAQRIPVRIAWSSAFEVAAAIGQGARFQAAVERRAELVRRFAALAHDNAMRRHFDTFADASPADFERLLAFLDWSEKNRSSGLLLRQIPVEGIHTKWLESRASLLVDLLVPLRPAKTPRDLTALCGLRKAPQRARVLFLGERPFGMRDVEAPLDELAALNMSPHTVFLIENVTSAVALPCFQGCVAVCALGKSVPVLAQVPWIARCPRLFYWGDLDTHGFAILALARAALPTLQSVLMDEATFLAHRELCVREPTQAKLVDDAHLTQDERAVYDALISNKWGNSLRLEQERLQWQRVTSALRARIS